MRLLTGVCEVFYKGRGNTWLPPYKRVVMLKDDGSIAIHSDSKYQPLNYMPKTDRIEVSESLVEAFGNGETLEVHFPDGFEERVIELGEGDPGLVRSGTERHLHQWLEGNLLELSENLQWVESEYETGNGAVDIFAFNNDSGTPAMVEVKRVATSTAVTQVRRYVEAMSERGIECEPVIVALEFKKRAIELCDKHKIRMVVAPDEYWTEEE